MLNLKKFTDLVSPYKRVTLSCRYVLGFLICIGFVFFNLWFFALCQVYYKFVENINFPTHIVQLIEKLIYEFPLLEIFSSLVPSLENYQKQCIVVFVILIQVCSKCVVTNLYVSARLLLLCSKLGHHSVVPSKWAKVQGKI